MFAVNVKLDCAHVLAMNEQDLDSFSENDLDAECSCQFQDCQQQETWICLTCKQQQSQPANINMISSDLSLTPYKKKLCTHFAKGHCNMDLDCSFAHGTGELRTMENPAFKTQLCTAYEQGGICSMGTDCLLAHGQEELRPLDDIVESGGTSGNVGGGLLTHMNGSATPVHEGTEKTGKKGAYKSSLCIHFSKSGSCSMGAKCSFAHGKDDMATSVPIPDKNDPRYKTKLCMIYERAAFCPNGDLCLFAHGNEELKEQNMENASKSRKQLYKTSLCTNFTTQGVCASGKNCLFAHGRYELRPIGFDGDFEAKVADNPKWKCVLCSIYEQTGRCTRTSCNFAHGDDELRQEHPESPKSAKSNNYKTVLCHHFATKGVCSHGEACAFAHGEDELSLLSGSAKEAFLSRKRNKRTMSGKPTERGLSNKSQAALGGKMGDQKMFAEFLEFKKFKMQSEETSGMNSLHSGAFDRLRMGDRNFSRSDYVY